METQFRNLDRAIESQPMPPQFQDTKAMVSCNDCYAKSAVSYHWLGLKCAICDSYNTAQLSILSDPDVEVPVVERREIEAAAILEELGGGESSIMHLGAVRQRRHSLHTHISSAASARFSPSQLPRRLGRSVSPINGSGLFDDTMPVDGTEMVDDLEDDNPDFWGRDEHRSVTSANNGDVDMDDDEESDEEEEDSDNEDSDFAMDDYDDEEDQFELIGHR
jgi:hypothetical protein